MRPFKIQPKHVKFLKLICSEMGYKEIAKEMKLSAKDCMNFTQMLCKTLKVKGRFGLMLYALKTKIVKPNEIKFKRIPGRLTLHKGLEVALRGTDILEESELLQEDTDFARETYERNVQKRLSHY